MEDDLTKQREENARVLNQLQQVRMELETNGGRLGGNKTYMDTPSQIGVAAVSTPYDNRLSDTERYSYENMVRRLEEENIGLRNEIQTLRMAKGVNGNIDPDLFKLEYLYDRNALLEDEVRNLRAMNERLKHQNELLLQSRNDYKVGDFRDVGVFSGNNNGHYIGNRTMSLEEELRSALKMNQNINSSIAHLNEEVRRGVKK
jgi:hypothetical protein